MTSASGPLHVKGETFIVRSEEPLQIFDLTDNVMARVMALGVREGTATLVSLHTTCSLFINETQDALHEDMVQFLKRVVDSTTPWLHNDSAHSECARKNAAAHLRAMVMNSTATLQVSGGELVLGRWQRVLMAELDGPQARTLRLQVMGVA